MKSVRAVTLTLLVFLSGAIGMAVAQSSAHSAPTLRVAFLDVGQGDAIFIESPTGSQMLIDGGFDRSVLRRLGEHMTLSDRTIDVVLATHPDADHIGGLISVLERYDVGHLFHAGVLADTPAYEAFESARTTSEAQSHVTQRDTIIDLGGGAYVRILFPDRMLTEHTETNQASAFAEVVYGDIEFLLTGDAPESIERYVLALEGESIESEVLKAGHHGSKTSSGEAFVAAVHPAYAVISAGKDNRYGHPHKEVLETFTAHDAAVLGTYERGDVLFETDGSSIWLIK